MMILQVKLSSLCSLYWKDAWHLTISFSVITCSALYKYWQKDFDYVCQSGGILLYCKEICVLLLKPHYPELPLAHLLGTLSVIQVGRKYNYVIIGIIYYLYTWIYGFCQDSVKFELSCVSRAHYPPQNVFIWKAKFLIPFKVHGLLLENRWRHVLLSKTLL